MNTDSIDTEHSWRPQLTDGLMIGPPRWTGSAMVTDVSGRNDERVIKLGVLERLALRTVDGSRDVEAIQAKLAQEDLELPLGKLYAMMNQFAVYGLLERPFATSSGVADLDAGRSERPSVRDDSTVLDSSAGGLAATWSRTGWLGNPAAFVLVCAVGLMGLTGLIWSVPQGWIEIATEPRWIGLALSVPIALAWHLVVTFAHESSHAALFHRFSARQPRLGVTRFGIVPLPNSQLSGLSLIATGQKARVIIIGPAVSSALSLAPVALLFVTESGSWAHQLAAVSVCLEALVIGLGVSFFPNTDATRVLETWAGVDQIQQVAFGTLVGRYSLPQALPKSTRFWVRIYPILLVLTILAWALAIAWAGWSVLV